MGKDLKDKGSKDQIIVSFMFEDKQYRDTDSSLRLTELTTEQVRIALNRAPAKYAYWAVVAAKIARHMTSLKDDYDFWYSSKYAAVDESYPKRTETFKKTQIVVGNSKQYKALRKQLAEVQFALDQANTLVKAYELQSRTLQTVGSLLKAEMELN